MPLTRIKLGELIEQVTETNAELKLGLDDVMGMTLSKEIIPTKADINPKELPKFTVVSKHDFIFNPRTHGEKIGFGFSEFDKKFLISWNNIAFHIKKTKETIINPYYLWMWLKRDEWDRFATFNSWGSSTEVFSWNSLCDMEIDLPDMEIQLKFVKIYNSMVQNQKIFEKTLNDLKFVCDASIEEIRKKVKIQPILPFLTERCETNKSGSVSLMKGVGLRGFIEPNQLRTEESLKKCNVFYLNDFVYAPSSIKNGVISFNDKFEKAICTEEYIVFHINKPERLNPYYLLLWLKREELGRYIDFVSIDSVRNRFYFKDLGIIEIPIPDIDIQDKVAKLYKNYLDRKEINDDLKDQIFNLCPVLIKGSIEEAMRS